jgi:alanyl-tRNA synthetase
MSENEQQTESQEQETVEVEKTDDTSADSNDTNENNGNSDEQVQETEKSDTEEFDADRAKAKIHSANNEAANLRKRLKALEKQNSELKPLAEKARKAEQENMTEVERLRAELTQRDEREAKTSARAVKSEIRAAAADLFADKTDPESYLTLSSYVDDEGEIDTTQIETDLTELLERKPHLGKPKADPPRKRPAPDPTQASSANNHRASDPSEEFAGFITSKLGRR